jgi:hypothetical protein
MASSSQIKPGEKGKITAKVDIRGRSNELSKSIQVSSNDPKRPVVTLFLKATIKKQE